jgi:enoyl-CoA hydratase/carnithine racemase
MTKAIEDKIVTRIEGDVGVVSLNRPSKLNVIDEQMVDQLGAALDAFKQDTNIKRVIINGNGPKGFCAGGDVVSVLSGIASGREVDFFFKKEYEVDHGIHNFPKPVTTVAHGFVFGGGFGIFAAGSSRVCLENTFFSMPEVTIGFFPDVASSFFLQEIPRSWRVLMGMCGARINAHWAFLLGLVDCVVPLDSHEDLVSNLVKESDEPSRLALSIPPESIEEFQEISDVICVIDEMESCEHFHIWVSEVLSKSSSTFLRSCASQYLNGSRLSSSITWKLFHWCEGKSLDQCFKMDLELSKLFGEHVDFKEGVRALLIDKDKSPQFKYKDALSIDNEALTSFARCFSNC